MILMIRSWMGSQYGVSGTTTLLVGLFMFVTSESDELASQSSVEKVLDQTGWRMLPWSHAYPRALVVFENEYSVPENRPEPYVIHDMRLADTRATLNTFDNLYSIIPIGFDRILPIVAGLRSKSTSHATLSRPPAI